MSTAEILWRILEKTKKLIDKSSDFKNPNIIFPLEKSIFSLSDYAYETDLKKKFPKSINYHKAIADSALKNCFDAFGITVCHNNSIDWFIDPITKKRWPQKFWGDIDYRDKTLGGVKFVWEINRLYCLFSLGIVYRITRDQKYADKILWIIKSWVKQNPYPLGINFSSGIEAGVRLANLLWALSFLKDYPFSDDDLKAIHLFVYVNAIRLKRFPSRYSSSNNHLLAEGFGLFIAGLYFPCLEGSDQWFIHGKKILEDEVSRQILSDGGSFEYSTTYLSFVFDFFLLFRFCCNKNQIEYSIELDRRLEKSCEFINSLMDKNGNIPNIGDQDSAVLVDFGLSNHENFQSILNTGSIIFGGDYLLSNKPDLKTFLITGKAIKQRIDRDIKHRLSAVKHKESGLSVIRDNVRGKEMLFVGNAMPLGMPPLYAHGHLDALSLTLTVDGKEIFIDPGTYLYHGGGKWREYFRSTAAHNTIRINGKDMTKQTGDFMFEKPYLVTKNVIEKDNHKMIWETGHDAYSKKDPFAFVERKVVWDNTQDEFTIMDIVRHKKPGFIEIFFHCHPGCEVTSIDDNFSIVNDGSTINLIYDGRLKPKILYGSDDPVAGWYSPGFNKIMKSSTIRLSGSFDTQTSFTTRIHIN